MRIDGAFLKNCKKSEDKNKKNRKKSEGEIAKNRMKSEDENSKNSTKSEDQPQKHSSVVHTKIQNLRIPLRNFRLKNTYFMVL